MNDFRLDLDAWINEPPPDLSSESEEELEVTNPVADIFVKSTADTKNHPEPTEEQLQKVCKNIYLLCLFKRVSV